MDTGELVTGLIDYVFVDAPFMVQQSGEFIYTVYDTGSLIH